MYTYQLKKSFSTVEEAIKEICTFSSECQNSYFDKLVNMSEEEIEHLNEYCNLPKINYIKGKCFLYNTSSRNEKLLLMIYPNKIKATYMVNSNENFDNSLEVKSFLENGWIGGIIYPFEKEFTPIMLQDPLWHYDVLPKRERIIRP